MIFSKITYGYPKSNQNNTDTKSLCDNYCYSIYTQLFMKIIDLKKYCCFIYGEDVSSIKIKLAEIFLKISISMEDEKYTTTIALINKKGIINGSLKVCLPYEGIYCSVLLLIKKIEK